MNYISIDQLNYFVTPSRLSQYYSEIKRKSNVNIIKFEYLKECL